MQPIHAARPSLRSRIANWLAPRLGLEGTRTPADWLVRLLFHAPRPGRRDVPQLVIAAFVARLASEWQIAARAPLPVWLWRAFVKPARAGGVAASVRAGIAGASLVWRMATAFAHRQQRRFDAALARLPWAPLSAALEGASRVAGRGRLAMFVIVLTGGALFVLASTAPLSTTAQLQFGAVSLAASLLIRRMPGRLPLLLLSSLALLMTARYAYWRATATLDFRSPGDTLVGYALFGAEAYTWMIQLFGFIQTAWPLQRAIVPMPPDPATWPTVDVYIPTYNEPLSVVRPTVFAAQGIDWPADKLRVYLLDDGRRPEFRAFAHAAGIEYLVRDDNHHAKAGNINRALERTHGEYIAIFDCDHVPARSFLQTTMGTFLREPKCAMVQTPHHFFSPDPFERNLATFHRVPNEGYLFYGLVQAGNDLWNASFFCGSCAIIKRSALEEVGGVAVETVTEDAHTALKLHRRGYTTAYLPTVQAAGLATESLASHIRQRVRWARGMAQIFRIDNPFFGRGLSMFQRLCYGNAMLHFFYGIPRLVFLTMPMAYLFFHMHFIHAPAPAIVAYVLPYIALANVANSRLQGGFRHSFWAEVYESVLAWYVALPTTIAVLSPKHGKFNVTDKGGRIDQGYFDWSVSRPYILLVALNALALAVGCWSLVAGDPYEVPTVLMNMLWTTYNLVLLGGALCVAREAKQTRANQRIAMRLPATLVLADGRSLACTTRDCSMGGFGLSLPEGQRFAKDEPMSVCVRRPGQEFSFPVRAVWQSGTQLGVKLEQLDLEAERRLVQLTMGRADAWIKWHDTELADRPLRGLRDVVGVGVRGYGRLGHDAVRATRAWFAAARARS
ncbi:UDP-forming cellulose synthase catalytic subunit [Caballeronia sp. RCC_10]|uniref:UDP-forming cellulose synthase catalytic subunit n=1 Tax=Caballeronia sp. RCC_10 TaxID=3239227 RepID=UPI003524DE23